MAYVAGKAADQYFDYTGFPVDWMTVAADHRRRVLRALVHSLNGRQEWFLRAHGIPAELVADLIEAGLATMQVEHRTTRGREIEVRIVRITDAGRQALAEWR